MALRHLPPRLEIAATLRMLRDIGRDAPLGSSHSRPRGLPVSLTFPVTLTRYTRERSLNLLFIVAVPLVLLLNNPNWLFTEVGGPDQWTYIGEALNYDKFFYRDYKASRYPWTFALYAAYKVFSPEIATIVVSLSFFCLATASLYLLLERLFDQRSAFVTAMFLTGEAEFQGNYGWSYHNTSAAAYYLLGLYCFVQAAHSRRSGVWLMAGGAAYFSSVCTNLFYGYLGIFPLMFFFFISAARKGWLALRPRAVAGSILYMLAGACAWAALLSWLYYRFTGVILIDFPVIGKMPFLFEQLDHALTFLKLWHSWIASGEAQIIPFVHGMTLSPSFLLPFLLFVLCGVLLAINLGNFARRRFGSSSGRDGGPQSPHATERLHESLAYAHHVILLGMFIYLYTQAEETIWPKHSSFPMVPSAAIALGAVIHRFGSGRPYPALSRVRWLATGIMVLPLIVTYRWNWVAPISVIGEDFWKPLAAGVVAFAVVMTFRRRRWAVFAMLGFLSLLNLFCANGSEPVGRYINYYIHDKCAHRKDLFLSSMDGDRFLSSLVGPSTSLMGFRTQYIYYYDYFDRMPIEKEPCPYAIRRLPFYIGGGIAAMRARWGDPSNYIENNDQPSPGHPTTMAQFVEGLPFDGTKVAVIGSVAALKGMVERVSAEALQHGKKLSLLAETKIERGDVAYGIAVLSIAPL